MAEQPIGEQGDTQSAVQQLAELIKTKNLANAQKLADVTSQGEASWDQRPEVQVQLARLHLRLGNEHPVKSAASRRHFAESLEWLQKCEATSEEMKDDYLVHYLYACVLGKVSEGESPKNRIKNAYVIRDHAKRAMELRPSEPGPHNLLGKWCHTVASVSTIVRLAAKALFGAPPEATLDEALEHLTKANELETPDSPTYVLNLLTLGEVCDAMKNRDDARKWYRKCAESRAEQSINVIETNHEKGMRAQARAALAKLR